MSTTAGSRPPRLARDAIRAWLATGVSALVSIMIEVARQRASGGADPWEELAVSLFVLLLVQLLVYQVLTWRVFAPLGVDQLRRVVLATTAHGRRARRREVLMGTGPRAWASAAAVLALAAALVIALDRGLRSNPAVLILSLAAVVAGWTMIVVAYALQYLRMDTAAPGLEFPGPDPPLWSDYVYLAVQVSITFSSSDADVTTRAMRAQVTAQSIIAFVFNTVIVALLVSALLAPG